MPIVSCLTVAEGIGRLFSSLTRCEFGFVSRPRDMLSRLQDVLSRLSLEYPSHLPGFSHQSTDRCELAAPGVRGRARCVSPSTASDWLDAPHRHVVQV